MRRRVRGVLGTAVTWGVTWAVAALALGSVILPLVASRLPTGMHPLDVLIQATLRWGLFGAVSGAAFAMVMAWRVRRGATLASLSVQRMQTWGAVGGALLPIALLPVVAVAMPVALGPAISVAAVGAILGTVSAHASLRVARRPPTEKVLAPVADDTVPTAR